MHLRVRLPRAARLGDGRHLGLPGAPEHGRDAGAARDLHDAAERDRRGDPDPRIEPAVGDAAGAEARQAVPRRLREEPLRRPHLHHAGAGRAQEVGAPEAQRDRAASSRAATCCWSTTRSCAAPPARRSCRWRATPARARSTWRAPRRRCAFRTCTASTCRRTDELVAHGRSDRGDPRSSSAPTR